MSISFNLIAKSGKGIAALEMFQKDCDVFLVRRLLTVKIINYGPFTLNVMPNQFMPGTMKVKNSETIKKTKKIVQEQWMKKYNVLDGIDYEVE